MSVRYDMYGYFSPQMSCLWRTSCYIDTKDFRIFQNCVYICETKLLKCAALLSFILNYNRYFVITLVKGKEHVLDLKISMPKHWRHWRFYLLCYLFFNIIIIKKPHLCVHSSFLLLSENYFRAAYEGIFFLKSKEMNNQMLIVSSD